MQLYQWLSKVAADRGSAKALVYRDTYLSWRGFLHRVDRRAQELTSLGIGAGAWVGLMLGNVPDFVILALALSKLDAVVVPLDPTTGNRELEMVLEAAPLRALITRPRGGEGGQAAAALPYYASPAVSRPPAGPPSKFVPENRRRLQGTLLTCSLYKRAPITGLTDGNPALVQFTATVGGDPKGVVKTAANLTAAAAAIGTTLEISAGRSLAVCDAAAHELRLRLRSSASPGAWNDVVPRGRNLARSASPSCCATTRLISSRGHPALYGALARVPTVKPLKTPRARFLSSGSAAARQRRGRVPPAFRHPALVLLPQHAGWAAGDRSGGTRFGQRGTVLRRGRAARGEPKAEKLAR